MDKLKSLDVKGAVSKVSAATKGSATSARAMKYPYTVTAKLVQFPWAYMYNNSWMFRYFIFATVLTAPIFYKIQKLSNNPENVAKWKEIHRKEAEGHH